MAHRERTFEERVADDEYGSAFQEVLRWST